MNLLEKIEEYIERTGTQPTVFSNHAMENPMFLQRLREGVTPRARTIERVMTFMDENPDGPAKALGSGAKRRPRRKGAHLVYSAIKNHIHIVKKSPTIDESRLVYVFRDPCEYCQVRRDIGCRHYPIKRVANG